VSEKYEFIDAEYADNRAAEAADAPTIVQMCSWLAVSKSGFYEWRSRPASATAQRRDLLKVKIKALFEPPTAPTATGESTPNWCVAASTSAPSWCAG
jgi:hypothetical protein